MLNRIRAVVVATALGAAALVALPGTATAAPEAAAAPEITALEVSADPVLVTGKDKVTVVFTITVDGAAEKAPETVEAYLKPAGLSVERKLTLAHSEKTKWTGSYEFDRESPPGTWTLRAEASRGAATDAASLTDTERLTDTESRTFTVTQVWETKIVAFDAAPEPAEEGGALTVRGRLLINGGDGWKPYGGRNVAITFARTRDHRAVASVQTGQNGWFTTTVTARRSGYWRAAFAGVPGESHPSVSGGDRVVVRPPVRQTRIVEFEAGPEPVDQGGALTVRGTLQVKSAKGWEGHRGQRVAILFKPDRATRWQRLAVAWTDGYGRFWRRFGATESGWWRVEYAGGRWIERAGSRADWVPVRAPERPAPARTRVIAFNAYPEPVRAGEPIRFRGQVQIWNGAAWTGHGRQKVAVYFKPVGGKWGYVKTTQTNSTGRFWTTTKSRETGSWRIVFAGDDTAARSVSRIDRVEVEP